ncbi:hypothetical protein CDD82_5651 [Ophiocordyceps australis]|uniref:1-phosphatidylinositol-3-phosphate 5-kinase n=1 Tax=Ophiocordyceps australis TaxID=1399860 RepID=A0A2C5YWR9_9HYPO|nr:hypothetical protein CDD82_5651 [Ophiocordyceps australis]
MADKTAPKPLAASPGSASRSSLTSFRPRRGSINSMSASSIVDKEQLAHALDKIHTSASQCDSLTTFNDFAPPPEGLPPPESRASAGELVQHGLSGLYTRFREAVGGSSPTKTILREHVDHADALPKRPSATDAHSSRPSVSSLSRAESHVSPSSTGLASPPVPTSDLSPASLTPVTSDSRSQMSQSAKAASISLMTGQKLHGTGRQSLPTKATSAVIAADPTIAPPPIITRDASRGTARNDDSGAQGPVRKSTSRADIHVHIPTADSSSPRVYDGQDGKLPPRCSRDESSSSQTSVETPLSPAKGVAIAPTPANQPLHTHSPSAASSLLPSPDKSRRRPAVIDRISRSRSPMRRGTRLSSPDRGTAKASPVNTSAHNSVQHDSFTPETHSRPRPSSSDRIPGTTAGQDRASEQMNAQLDRMRRQVLSKEFWMKDDTVKECFLCQTPFTAFRRKHHCRTCGCIFDSKCTTLVSGEKFGVAGSLRVCKNCLDVISRRLDASASDDSADERSFLPRIFGPTHSHSKGSSGASHSKTKDHQDVVLGSEGSEDARPGSTPMMTIPATRRVRESNRSSAVLEIDAFHQLSRPGSSRSLKSLSTARPQSSGHKRHHSKHGFLGRFKGVPQLPPPEDRAPFRKGIDDESAKKSKFPVFHDDNIIDPELADYMSEDTSGDEQVSIFATMGTSDLPSASFDSERPGLSPFVNATRKHRHRAGDKSISGMSYVSRGAFDDTNGASGLASHRRSTRRRNLSNVSGSVHHLASPRPKSGIYKGPSASSEMLFALDTPSQPGTGQMPVNDVLHTRESNKQELNQSSLSHVNTLLHQLLEDGGISPLTAWKKALAPILLQLTDDVTPDVAKGEDMDIRHYVKLKRIPGGRPGDTTYVSGVVFTKNLALKSMPRRIANPRIVLVTFPIEYQRHQQQLMSLQPVIEQEKEYLRVVVQRITNLRPHVLLAQKGVSGVALQYLSEANIAVAYNVKDTVIEAVARCAEAEIIETVDMLALPVRVGKCSTFEVRTFVNNDYPGRKKSYIFLSGCRADLGCTIALRGSNNSVLSKMKHIMDFMVYVVYNLKLEMSLLRDESVDPPDATGDSSSVSSSLHAMNDSFRSWSSASGTEGGSRGLVQATTASKLSGDGETTLQTPDDVPCSSINEDGEAPMDNDNKKQPISQGAIERSKLISLHEHHASHDSQVPDDVPMPTFYSDMVAKYETKILSASPYVKFKQPYLLMRAREQERRLLYLRRLRDQDAVEEDSDKSGPQRFQLIKPEMVEKIGQKAPRQIMEILHAVHDAEYDKALSNYQTQTRQWEAYIQGNLDLFDPYSHQNIVVLYSVTCTETKIPCLEPSLVAINFYDEQHVDTGMDPDCTLGQYIEDLALSKNDICNSNGCEKTMAEHHRTYVHDQYRVTAFVENVLPSFGPRHHELGEAVTMWTYCKICKKDSRETAMSEATFKYSFGKYLELLFWGRGLRMKNSIECPHQGHGDLVRYFNMGDSRIRIHCDPIDLLEIVVPRARITWKVVNDLKLKNEVYTRMEERWSKFMASVRARLKSIRIDSVLPEKAESCKAEVERLMKKTQEEQPAMVRQLQGIYVNTKYYEVMPFNSLVRDMLEKAGEWDQAFAKLEADFLGDKDMRQLTIMQLRKMFTDNESKESLTSSEMASVSTTDHEERSSQEALDPDEKAATQAAGRADSVLSGEKADMERSMEERQSGGQKGQEDVAKVPGDAVSATDAQGEATMPAIVKAESAPTVPRVSDTVRGELAGCSSSNDEQPPSPSQVVDAAAAFASAAVSASPRRPASPTGLGRSPTGSSLSGQSFSDKVDLLRREQASFQAAEGLDSQSDVVRPRTERSNGRNSVSGASMPMLRTASHPTRPLPIRAQSSLVKPLAVREARALSSMSSTDMPGQQQVAEGSVKADKKLSDRLGLGALKHRSKGTTSSIPRLVHKKRESRVSTLARHFEQLSREFEKERIRDRKQRAANLRQPRARLPRTSTKAIVQVYDDVNQAFEEPPVSAEQTVEPVKEEQRQTSMTPNSGMTEVPACEAPSRCRSPTTGNMLPPAESLRQTDDNDDTSVANTSQMASDEEAGASDGEALVCDDFLPDIKEIADALEPSTEIPLELPKHQKTSLMKYLTNFWAERSASGWPPLEYPVNATDHIFVDSNIIVREDEPSSVIALALNSDDYKEKLANIRHDAQGMMQRDSEGTGDSAEQKSMPASDSADWRMDEMEQEKSLLRATGTHLKYQFKEGSAIMTCKIFYAEQFDALRRKCGVAERIIESLSRCLKWDSKGGKTKSVFLKTLDDRLVLKSLSPVETSAFLRFAPGYFSIMAEALFHDLPSVIAKMLGFFQVIIKNSMTGTDIKLDLLVTENLFYDRTPSRIFDLKGSMRNRKIQSTGEQNEVLLDENMVEYIYESPLFAREHSKKLLRASVWNDTLFLAKQNVMDYSLMIAVDEEKKELVVGIIDCIRTYTWDKKLESWIKDRGFAGGRNRPTVTSPKEYKSRFREAMAR